MEIDLPTSASFIPRGEGPEERWCFRHAARAAVLEDKAFDVKLIDYSDPEYYYTDGGTKQWYCPECHTENY